MSKILLLALIAFSLSAKGQTIVGTKHDLSAGGTSTIRAATEDQICIFCHTPHRSTPAAPLWNRDDPGTFYDSLYTSTTLDGTSGQPDGSSVLCLSCHDGTVALGNVVSRGTNISMVGGDFMSGRGNLGTNLSNDHPVSYIYSSGDSELISEGSIGSNIILEGGKIQCTSCHDPHKNTYTKFLVETNEGSVLCLSCHDKTGWSTSIHKLSTKPWLGGGDNPWAHIEQPYTTVEQNACENCHDPHNAGEGVRLLKAPVFENNCTDCHDGSVAAKNIAADISQPNSHSGYAYSDHDPGEGVSPTTQHVICVDCHSPHEVTLGNPLFGVPGVNASGSPVGTISNSYELCFRCHAGGNAFQLPTTARRLGTTVDLIQDFSGTLSGHPVLTPSDGTGRALQPPWDAVGVVIECSDCHASDDPANAGPHGSIYPRILKANYNMAETMPKNIDIGVEFALCFTCHDQTGVEDLHDSMKRGHFLTYTTCNTCHDPHGFSGGIPANNSYLINLSTTATGPNGDGSHDIVMNLNPPPGAPTGTCNFTCHAKSHEHSNAGGDY